MSDSIPRNLAAGAAHGAVGAMAMSGMRRVTIGLGWLEKLPPKEIIAESAPDVLRSVARDQEHVVIEAAHWAYGSLCGAAYRLLPRRVRRSRLSGPAFGLATWLTFELGIAPALGIRSAERKTIVSRAALVADHVLFGLVVAANDPSPDDDRESDDQDERDEQPAAPEIAPGGGVARAAV